MGVYGKEPLSCTDHSDKNIFYLVKKPCMELLFNLYKSLVRLPNCKAVEKHQNIKWRIFLKISGFSRSTERRYTNQTYLCEDIRCQIRCETLLSITRNNKPIEKSFLA